MPHRPLAAALAALLIACAAPAPLAPVAAASAATLLPAQPALDLPNTPAGRAAEAWVDAVRSGDPDTIRDMIETVFDAGFRDEFGVDAHLRMHETILHEEPKFHSVASADDEQVVIYTDVGHGWGELVIQIHPRAPHGIIGISLRPSDGPGVEAPTRAASDAELVAAMDERLDRLAGEDRFAGAVLVQRGNQVVYQGARGLASRRYDAPNTIETRFNLGSANKMFTAVSIAQLAESGKLTYDDTLGQHVPDFPNKEIRDKVTIHHLLTHTSGMGSHFTEEFMGGSKRTYRTLHDYLPLFQDEPLAFEPGERFAYSNAGMFVLGLVVEAASGQDYYAYVREHILEPAGMTRTGHFDMDIPVRELATGYYQVSDEDLEAEGDTDAPWKAEFGAWRENTFLHSIKGGPAGGAFSTCGDMARFSKALRDGTLVSPDSLATLTKGRSEMGGPDVRYAYGFVEQYTNGIRSFGHSGGFPGITAFFRVYPEIDLTVVVFANAGSGAAVDRALTASIPDLEP